MGPTPWWVTLVVGALTVSSSFLAARIGANRSSEATDQREKASAREEWFKRFEWATELTLQSDDAAKAAGFAALGALATSKLASVDDLKLLAALTANTGLNELEGDYREEVDETDFFEDDEEAGNEIQPAKPSQEEPHDDDQ